MKPAPAKETQLLFDMFGEQPVAEVEPAAAAPADIPIEWQIPGENVSNVVVLPTRCILAPAWPRDVAVDPCERRYESGASFVHLSGERASKGWRASLLLTVADSFEMGEPFTMSAFHKTLGDALGSVRHHAMERLRAEAARIHGSFPPPKGSEVDDATALYWALGREDFRDLADPAPIMEPALEVALATETPAIEIIEPLDPPTEEALDWRIPGALARIRVFHPRPDSGETWTWAVEWSTGSSSEVEAVQPAESRADCVERGRTRLLKTFSGIAIKGEAYTSRKAEHDRSCALYRLVLANKLPIDLAEPEPMKEAA